MIKVFVADEHRILRDGLRRILDDDERMEVVGEASTFGDLLADLDASGPEVVVLDISLPGPGFQEALRVLIRRGVSVVALGNQPEARFGARSLKAGASAYLSKERTAEELLWAIRRAHEGRTYQTPDTARELVRKGGNGEGAHDELSQREFQVLLLLGAGNTVGEIARQLALSPKTVSTYRARILEKTRLATTADIVRYVLEQGLL